MDYQTAAAVSRNISGIADAFLQMSDPRTKAKARLLQAQEEEQRLRSEGLAIENQFRPGVMQAQIGLDQARAATESNRQGYYDAQAGRAGAEADLFRTRNRAASELIDSPGGVFQAPFTNFSQGAAVGGPDELQDSWTNKGYSATGPNLVPGVVAVDPSVHPLGTIFQNPETGEAFIAADKHGNSNPNVIDFYKTPDTYTQDRGTVPLRVVGREKLPYGTTGNEIQDILSRYSRLANVAALGGADDLSRSFARNQAMTAPDELSARQAATAISGQLPGVGEYFDPANSDAFQQRGIAGDLQQEAMRQQGMNQREAANILLGGGGGGGASGASGAGLGGDMLLGTKNPFAQSANMEFLQSQAAIRFGIADDDGNLAVDRQLAPFAINWQASVSSLTQAGVNPQLAMAIADQHHNTAAIDTAGEGWMDGDPRREIGSGFNPQSLTPADAAQVAAALGGPMPLGAPASNEFAARASVAASLDPSLASAFGQQAAPAPALVAPEASPAKAPEEQAPKSEGRASDAFQMKETAKQAKEREKKEARVASLREQIQTISDSLKRGGTSMPAITPNPSGLGAGIAPSPSSRKHSPETHNRMLSRLRQLEDELATLTGGGGADPISLEQLYRSK